MLALTGQRRDEVAEMEWSHVDLDRRMAFGYAQNRWMRGAHELDRSRGLLGAVYASMA